MPWNNKFDEGNYEWPLEAYVNVEYLLNLPINGSGGWQNLLKFLQDNVDKEEETIHLGQISISIEGCLPMLGASRPRFVSCPNPKTRLI